MKCIDRFVAGEGNWQDADISDLSPEYQTWYHEFITAFDEALEKYPFSHPSDAPRPPRDADKVLRRLLSEPPENEFDNSMIANALLIGLAAHQQHNTRNSWREW